MRRYVDDRNSCTFGSEFQLPSMRYTYLILVCVCFLMGIHSLLRFVHFSHFRRSSTSTVGNWWPLCPCSLTPTPISWPPCWASWDLRCFSPETTSYEKELWVKKCTSFSTASPESSRNPVRRWSWQTAPTLEVSRKKCKRADSELLVVCLHENLGAVRTLICWFWLQIHIWIVIKVSIIVHFTYQASANFVFKYSSTPEKNWNVMLEKGKKFAFLYPQVYPLRGIHFLLISEELSRWSLLRDVTPSYSSFTDFVISQLFWRLLHHHPCIHPNSVSPQNFSWLSRGLVSVYLVPKSVGSHLSSFRC